MSTSTEQYADRLASSFFPISRLYFKSCQPVHPPSASFIGHCMATHRQSFLCQPSKARQLPLKGPCWSYCVSHCPEGSSGSTWTNLLRLGLHPGLHSLILLPDELTVVAAEDERLDHQGESRSHQKIGDGDDMLSHQCPFQARAIIRCITKTAVSPHRLKDSQPDSSPRGMV